MYHRHWHDRAVARVSMLALLAGPLLSGHEPFLSGSATAATTFVDSGQRLGGNVNAADVVLADVDADGDLDAVEAVAVGDLDGDGDLDVFVATSGVPSRVWFNQSSPPPPTLPEYTITTFAGTGTAGAGGDGGPGLSAQLEGPRDLAVDAVGNVYLADFFGERIRKVATNGVISTLVSAARQGFGGDGGPVESALFDGTRSAAVDGAGSIFVSDVRNNRIRRIDPAGIVSTYAGSDMSGFSGDGAPATAAKLHTPVTVRVDSRGNLHFVDFANYRIRRVDTNGVITTIAGNGQFGFSGDGGVATNTSLNGLEGLAVDEAGNVYFTDTTGHRIRKVGFDGGIATVVGTGVEGLSGGGGLATMARLDSPGGLVVDRGGNLFLGDISRIRRVDSNGTILTVAGGRGGFSGDGGSALRAGIEGAPSALAFLPNGDLLFCTGNRVRRLSPTGNNLPVFRKYISTPPSGSAVNFGTLTRNTPQSWSDSVIQIYNEGSADLMIESVELLGDTSAFHATIVDASYLTVSLPHAIPEGLSGESLSVTLSCLVSKETVSTNAATLRIRTNDPQKPVVEFSLDAAVVGSDDDNPEFESTLEETFLTLFIFRGGGAADAAGLGSPARHRHGALHGLDTVQQVTLKLDPTMPHSVKSEIPAFLGGGTVTISNFSGSLTATATPVPGDPDHSSLRVDGGSFAAPSILLPSGVSTGPIKLTFGPSSESEGLLNHVDGSYTASASATIVNDLFPQGFPVKGTYSGVFDSALGQASVKSKSTDLFEKASRLRFLQEEGMLRLVWTASKDVLESAANIPGPWTVVPNSASPYSVDIRQQAGGFYRLRQTGP